MFLKTFSSFALLQCVSEYGSRLLIQTLKGSISTVFICPHLKNLVVTSLKSSQFWMDSFGNFHETVATAAEDAKM